MRFAHIADAHIGGWRDPVLREMSLCAWKEAVDRCRRAKVEFILISGDLFNSAIPAIDCLKTVVETLRTLRDDSIPVYTVAGSHDYSPSGKTMLDVLESAGLCVNVVRGRVEAGALRLDFTPGPGGVKLAGMVGRRGMLEKSYYEDLDRAALEREQGSKIFLFHSAITELKPRELEKMDSSPLSMLPKGFLYYAGGHVHERIERTEPGYGPIVFPGPLFPNSFSELEKLGCGGFYMYDEGRISFQPLQVCNIHPISVSCSGPEDCMQKLGEEIQKHEFFNSVVTIRISGTFTHGSASQVRWKELFGRLAERGAIAVLRNTSQVERPEFEEVTIAEDTVDATEQKLILEHLGKQGLWPKEAERANTERLMQVFSRDKADGERVADYESRLVKDADASF